MNISRRRFGYISDPRWPACSPGLRSGRAGLDIVLPAISAGDISLRPTLACVVGSLIVTVVHRALVAYPLGEVSDFQPSLAEMDGVA